MSINDEHELQRLKEIYNEYEIMLKKKENILISMFFMLLSIPVVVAFIFQPFGENYSVTYIVTYILVLSIAIGIGISYIFRLMKDIKEIERLLFEIEEKIKHREDDDKKSTTDMSINDKDERQRLVEIYNEYAIMHKKKDKILVSIYYALILSIPVYIFTFPLFGIELNSATGISVMLIVTITGLGYCFRLGKEIFKLEDLLFEIDEKLNIMITGINNS